MAAKPLIVIVGPTASGKSALGMELAKKFNGEIICADSRTVYKKLDIGTAKPTKADQEAVPHHLLDVVSPDEPFTVADFQQLANKAIENILKKNKVPIMVGGSGLYVDAVLYNYGFSKEGTPRDKQNPRHLSKDAPSSKQELRPDTLIIGLSVERDVLKQRITKRVDSMLEQGLLEEVEWLMKTYPKSKAMLAPGYKAFSEHINGRIKLQEAKELFIRNDYQLAKRQMTWFKRNKSIHWLTQQRQAVELVATFLYK